VLSSATIPATRCAVKLLSIKSDHGTFGMVYQRWIVTSGSAPDFNATAAEFIGSCRHGGRLMESACFRCQARHLRRAIALI
jgi:hypothetical protein